MTQPSADPGKRRFPASVTGFLFAPVLWSGYFVALYALEGAACRAGIQAHARGAFDMQKFAEIALMTAVALAMLAVTLWDMRIWLRLRREPPGDPRGRRAQRQFFAFSGALVSGLFCIGTVWIGVGALPFPSCQEY